MITAFSWPLRPPRWISNSCSAAPGHLVRRTACGVCSARSAQFSTAQFSTVQRGSVVVCVGDHGECVAFEAAPMDFEHPRYRPRPSSPPHGPWCAFSMVQHHSTRVGRHFWVPCMDLRGDGPPRTPAERRPVPQECLRTCAYLRIPAHTCTCANRIVQLSGSAPFSELVSYYPSKRRRQGQGLWLGKASPRTTRKTNPASA